MHTQSETFAHVEKFPFVRCMVIVFFFFIISFASISGAILSPCTTTRLVNRCKIVKKMTIAFDCCSHLEAHTYGSDCAVSRRFLLPPGPHSVHCCTRSPSAKIIKIKLKVYGPFCHITHTAVACLFCFIFYHF